MHYGSGIRIQHGTFTSLDKKYPGSPSSSTLIGVMVDKGLNFIKQAEYVQNSANRKMNALKVVSSLAGVNAKILKQHS